MSAPNPAPSDLRLRRTLSLWQLIIIGLVITQPIAPMGIFGSVHNQTGGHTILALLFAMVAMLFTAISYGRMASVHPSSGSAYTYVSEEISPILGNITGWAMVLDYLLNPLICVVICSKLTQNIWPSVPYWAFVIAYALLMTALNLRGIKTSARINEVLCAGMVLVVFIFFIAVIRYMTGSGPHTLAEFTLPIYNRETFHATTLFAGTAVVTLTYIGFDGVSTFAEEVKNPRRNILLATVLVCFFTGILSSLEVYAAQVVWGSRPFPTETIESAFPLVARQIGGWTMFHLLNLTILVASVASGMGAQLAAARLLYGMGRSNALPQKFFGALHPHTRIPGNNVLFTGAIAFVGAFLFTYESGAELLNFGAFIAFMGVNAASFAHFYIVARKRSIANLLPPVLGFATCLFIWWSLSAFAKIVGAVFLLAAMAYGLWRSRTYQLQAIRFESADE